jgi:hypothetical protein
MRFDRFLSVEPYTSKTGKKGIGRLPAYTETNPAWFPHTVMGYIIRRWYPHYYYPAKDYNLAFHRVLNAYSSFFGRLGLSEIVYNKGSRSLGVVQTRYSYFSIGEDKIRKLLFYRRFCKEHSINDPITYRLTQKDVVI